jgi:hypothetical protein
MADSIDRSALFDNSVAPGHNSSPFSIHRQFALAGSRGKKSGAGMCILPWVVGAKSSSPDFLPELA